jgi:hypothetical protein
MKIPELINRFIEIFSNEINKVPDDFYNTFQYTKTGKNLTHPRTLGYITKVLWSWENVSNLCIDLRVNVKKVDKKGKVQKAKFQPDISVFDGDNHPLLFLDYESPNSSDDRIPSKDIIPYLQQGKSTPYIVITTLPDSESPMWSVKWAATKHKRKLKEIRKNPAEYWYKFYKHELNNYVDNINNIYFINIDGKNKVSFGNLYDF